MLKVSSWCTLNLPSLPNSTPSQLSLLLKPGGLGWYGRHGTGSEESGCVPIMFFTHHSIFHQLFGIFLLSLEKSTQHNWNRLTYTLVSEKIYRRDKNVNWRHTRWIDSVTVWHIVRNKNRNKNKRTLIVRRAGLSNVGCCDVGNHWFSPLRPRRAQSYCGFQIQWWSTSKCQQLIINLSFLTGPMSNKTIAGKCTELKLEWSQKILTWIERNWEELKMIVQRPCKGGQSVAGEMFTISRWIPNDE